MIKNLQMGESFLDYLGCPYKREVEGLESESDLKMLCSSFEDEGRGHGLGNAGHLFKLEKSRESI